MSTPCYHCGEQTDKRYEVAKSWGDIVRYLCGKCLDRHYWIRKLEEIGGNVYSVGQRVSVTKGIFDEHALYAKPGDAGSVREVSIRESGGVIYRVAMDLTGLQLMISETDLKGE